LLVISHGISFILEDVLALTILFATGLAIYVAAALIASLEYGHFYYKKLII
jgi:hypothetical protein